MSISSDADQNGVVCQHADLLFKHEAHSSVLPKFFNLARMLSHLVNSLGQITYEISYHLDNVDGQVS